MHYSSISHVTAVKVVILGQFIHICLDDFLDYEGDFVDRTERSTINK